VLQRVNPGNKSLADYRSIIHRHLYDEVVELSERLNGIRVLHVNATSFGGGVAEILYTLVPLMRDVGLETEWGVMFGAEPFFNVTKGFHNALQGQEWPLDVQGKEIYLGHNRSCAEMLDPDDYDVVIVHDPQPAAFPHFVAANHARWVWRCHIDSSQPNDAVWQFLRPYVSQYDAAVFTMKEFVPRGLSGHPDAYALHLGGL
jgi:trehalose synthase